MTAAAQMYPKCEIVIAGARFTVAGRAHVSFMETTDTAFSTPEGVHVGMTLAQVRALGATDVRAETGWRFYARLPSGWNTSFAGVPSVTLPAELPHDAVVTSLFMRE